tara:strand:+ start:1262 stop:1774 length:513 start_codon:yes stop_codon:yes gene_type:complete
MIKGVKNAVSKTAAKGVRSAKDGFEKIFPMCTSETLASCFISIFVVIYVIILNQHNALEVFGTMWGKAVAVLVLLVALSLDARMGALVAVGVVLSLVYAEMNKSIESFNGMEYMTDAEELPFVEDSEDSEDVVESMEVSGAPIEEVLSEENSEDSEDMMESFEDYAPANF